MEAGHARDARPEAAYDGRRFITTTGMLSILGATQDDIEEILKGLGYRADPVPRKKRRLTSPALEAAQAEAAGGTSGPVVEVVASRTAADRPLKPPHRLKTLRPRRKLQKTPLPKLLPMPRKPRWPTTQLPSLPKRRPRVLPVSPRRLKVMPQRLTLRKKRKRRVRCCCGGPAAVRTGNAVRARHPAKAAAAATVATATPGPVRSRMVKVPPMVMVVPTGATAESRATRARADPAGAVRADQATSPDTAGMRTVAAAMTVRSARRNRSIRIHPSQRWQPCVTS
jgi:hypothetical protein